MRYSVSGLWGIVDVRIFVTYSETVQNLWDMSRYRSSPGRVLYWSIVFFQIFSDFVQSTAHMYSLVWCKNHFRFSTIVSFKTNNIGRCLLYGAIVLRRSFRTIFESLFELKFCTFPLFILCDTGNCSSHSALNSGLLWVSVFEKVILALGSFRHISDWQLSVALLSGLSQH